MVLQADRPWALELDAAFLCDRRLLNGNHLSLHLGQLGRGLLVAATKNAAGQKMTIAAAVATPLRA
jgi:hypothetical protein